MKKIITILFLLLMSGCSNSLGADIQAIDSNLQLKTTKDKILDSKVITIPEQTLIASSTGKQIIVPAESYVEYSYISDKEVTPAQISIGKKTIGEELGKRTANSQTFKISQTATSTTYQTNFYANNVFIKSDDKWFYKEYATTTIDAWNEQTEVSLFYKIKNYFFGKALADNFPTVPGAGRGISYIFGGTPWSTVHDAVSGTANNTFLDIQSGRYSGNQYYIYRGNIPIDTSALGSSVNITAATLYIYCWSKTDMADAYSYITTVQTTQASPTAIEAADYGRFGTTEGNDSGDRKDITAISTNAYFSINLNATGISWISKTGYTMLGAREGHDNENVAVTVDNQSTVNSIKPGTVNEPYLAITYSIASAEEIITNVTIF